MNNEFCHVENVPGKTPIYAPAGNILVRDAKRRLVKLNDKPIPCGKSQDTALMAALRGREFVYWESERGKYFVTLDKKGVLHYDRFNR